MQKGGQTDHRMDHQEFQKKVAETEKEISVQVHPIGYVIELSRGQYFRKVQNQRICCAALFRAKYYPTWEAAEEDVWTYLGYVGLDPYICSVCWTLILVESLESEWQYWDGSTYVPDDRDAVRFSSYEEAVDYQKKYLLQKTGTAELHCFRDKQIILAA